VTRLRLHFLGSTGAEVGASLVGVAPRWRLVSVHCRDGVCVAEFACGKVGPGAAGVSGARRVRRLGAHMLQSIPGDKD